MPSTAKRLVLSKTDGEVLVLRINVAQLNSDALAEALRKEMLEIQANSKAKKIAIDLTGVEYITTMGFQPLLSMRRKIHAAGGHVVVCGLSPEVNEVFEVTRLIAKQPGVLAVFEWAPDVPAAVKLLKTL